MSDQPITVHGDTRFGPVEWRVREPEHFRRCTWCGSMHPEDFLAAAKAGAKIDRGVDWKYGWPHKVYVHVPNPNPEMLFCVGSRNTPKIGPYAPGGERYRPLEPQYVPAEQLTPEQVAILRRDGVLHAEEGPSPGSGYQFGTRSDFFAKFYNVHQAEPWVTDELRRAIGFHVGYIIEPAGDGQIRWRAYDYAAHSQEADA